jgi:hypothetical protein
MKYTYLLFVLMLLANRSFCQSIPWKDATQWKLYRIYSKDAFEFPIDTLSNFPSYSLNTDSIRSLLYDISVVPKEMTPVWMGYYVASCRLPDGTLRKIEISFYAGFFYDDRTQVYYQIRDDLRKEWLNYLADCGASLPAAKN